MITSEWPTASRPEWAPFVVQQVRFLREAGHDITVLAFRGARNPLNYVGAWLRVRRALHGGEFDLIHAQFGQSGLLGLPKTVPLVVTLHGSDIQGTVGQSGGYTLAGKVLAAMSRLVACLADEVVVVAEVLGQKLPKRVKYHVIPSGLRMDLFAPMDRSAARARLNLPTDKKLILFGGRPDMPVKRYWLAEAAVAHLADPGVELMAVNDVPHYKMPLYMNAADLLLLTSRHEGSPVMVKEALACNLPVVSTDVGDVRARIGEIEGCAVCGDDLPQTIAAAIREVLRRSEPIDGRKMVADVDESALTQEVIEVYRQAVAKGPPR